jgi:hypothetical protein
MKQAKKKPAVIAGCYLNVDAKHHNLYYEIWGFVSISSPFLNSDIFIAYLM